MQRDKFNRAGELIALAHMARNEKNDLATAAELLDLAMRSPDMPDLIAAIQEANEEAFEESEESVEDEAELDLEPIEEVEASDDGVDFEMEVASALERVLAKYQVESGEDCDEDEVEFDEEAEEPSEDDEEMEEPVESSVARRFIDRRERRESLSREERAALNRSSLNGSKGVRQ